MNKPIQINIYGKSKQDFLDSNKFFLLQLKKYYDLFKNNLKEFEKKWNLKYNEHFSIIPEKKRYLSPITILDGEWGIGKTYFIETLIQNCSTSKIDLISLCGFKKIIVIDLWEYINNKEMINDIVFDIYNKLIPKSKKWNNLIKKIFKNSLRASGVLLWNIFTSGNLGLSYNFDKNIYKKIKKIRNDLKNIDPTIIIFDNIERIDSGVNEIIKLVQKISSIDNLLIIFIMNQNAFNVINKSIGFEKYITLGKYFEFSQDYKSYLLSRDINEFYANDINFLLKSKDDFNKNISIRDLEKKLHSNDLNKNLLKSKYDGYFYVNKYIWKCDNKIKELISKDIDKFFNKYISDFTNIRNEFVNNCKNFFPLQPQSIGTWYSYYNNYNSNNEFKNKQQIYSLFYKENTNIAKELEKINIFFNRLEPQINIKIFINYEKIIDEIEKIIKNKKKKKNYKNVCKGDIKETNEIVNNVISIWTNIQKLFVEHKQNIKELKQNFINETQFIDIFTIANAYIKDNNYSFSQQEFINFIAKNYLEEKYE